MTEEQQLEEKIRGLLKDGWRFRYDAATRYLTGEHPRGGAFSVFEVRFSSRPSVQVGDDGPVWAALFSVLLNRLGDRIVAREEGST